MYLRPRTKIVFTQKPTNKYPLRKSVWVFNFVEKGSVSSSWANLTCTAKISLPKNIFIQDEFGNNISWQGQNVIAGTSPILLRGDSISIEIGYSYKDGKGGEETVTNVIFEGFVSDVNPKVPVEITCEDNMYILKKTRVENKTWSGKNYTIESMLTEMLKPTSFTIKTDIVQANLGELRTMNATISQVLDQLKSDYKVQASFVGNQLRCGAIVYYPQDRKEQTFTFQDNIFDGHSLIYTRIDDVHVGIKAFSIDKTELTNLNKDGTPKTTKTRLETFVGDADGEIRTLYFWDVKTVDELKKQATDRLTRILYEGYRGDFTTIGLPRMRWGDAAVLVNPLIPEMNGTYLIKQVETTFGNEGIQQKLTLDLRIDQMTDDQLAEGL